MEKKEQWLVEYPLVLNPIFLSVFNKRIKGLAGLTSEILKKEIKEEDILIKNTTESNGVDLKLSQMDIRYSVVDGANINLEMQNKKPSYRMQSRLLYYLGHLITESVPKGTPYVLKQSYVIGILNFNLYNDNLPMREFTLKDEMGNEIPYAKIIIIELKKAKFCNSKILKKWMELFVAKNLKEYEETDEMKDVRDGILEANADAAIRDYLFKLKVQERLELDSLELAEARGQEKGRKCGIEEGRKRGIEEGRKYGLEEGCIMTAEKMYELGVPKDIICKAAGLTEEKLDNLIKRLEEAK